MNWFKENKFVAGLLIITILGAGAFIYLWLGAGSQLEEATAAYQQQVQERSRLLSLKPYPSQENVKELVAQKEQATAKITALHKALAAAELPLEPVAPVKFQDTLREAVTKVKEFAAGKSKLPDKFFLGFDRYETTTPDANAAPQLARQLKAIQWLVDRFIEARATEIRQLDRDPLPAESGKEAEAPPPPPVRGGRPAKADAPPPAPLFAAYGMDLRVLGDPVSLRTVLNEIVQNKDQFFIIRRVAFRNEKEKAPARAVEGAATPGGAAPADGAAPDPNAPAASAAPISKYIVGDEKVEMTLRLEMIDFTEPGKADEKKGAR